jgi:uncharacterized protein YoxC
MDALILDLSNVSAQILPILGAVALIFLCVLLKKIWELIDTINQSVQKLDPTIKDVEKSMEKLQAPLDTAVKYSHSLDKVHDKTSEVLTKATDFASENMNKFQTAMEEKMKKEDEVKVVEVEDKEDE